MKFKKVLFWTLIFYFVLILPLSQIIEAQRIEFFHWQQQAAAKASYYQQLNSYAQRLAKKAINPITDLTKISAVKAQGNDVEAEAAAEADATEERLRQEQAAQTTTPQQPTATPQISAEACQADPKCKDLPIFALAAPESATLGDTIPVTIVAQRAQKVSKVNLLIDDPSSGKTHFKDSFVNIKQRDAFTFTYNWDTFFAQTKADSSNSAHKITAEFYHFNGSKYILMGKVEAKTKINPFTGYDPLKDAFWGGFLREDDSFNQAWADKLGCANSSNCKDQESVKDAFKAGVDSGSITEEDITNLNNTLSLYTYQLKKEGFVDSEENAKKIGDWINMSDMAGVADESMNNKLGVPSDDPSEDFLKSPEMVSVATILEQYTMKIASYDPQSPEEFKAMPIWKEIEKKIDGKISKNPIDLPFEESGATQSSMNFFRMEKAHATWLSLGLSIGMLAYDAYKFVKEPSWAHAGMIGLDLVAGAADVFMLPGGELIGGARLGSKGLAIGAKIMSKLPALGRLANRGRQVFEAIKGGEVIAKVLTKIPGLEKAYTAGKAALEAFIGSNKYLSKILETVKPMASKAMEWYRGMIKKFLSLGGKAAEFLKAHPALAASLGLHFVASGIEACEKKGAWEKVKGVAQTFTNPLGKAVDWMMCIILQAINNAIGTIIDWVMPILRWTYVPPGKFLAITNKAVGNLAFWRVDTAHASISAALNPDNEVSGWMFTTNKAEFIINIWETLRLFINIFLAFMIIFLAFANIFRININNYAIKKTLPGLLLGVLLANLSGLICRLILDLSTLLSTLVTAGHPGIVMTEALSTLTMEIILSMFKSVIGLGLSPFVFFFGLIFGLAILIGLLMIVFTLALRIGIIFTLYAISPLAFLCLGSPLTNGLFKKWWDEFIRWAFIPVVMFFLMWIASQVSPVERASDAIADATIYNIIKTVMIIALLWTSVILPWKMKGWLGGMVMGFAMGNILKPAQQWSKKGLAYGYDSGKGYYQKQAAAKGWFDPFTARAAWVAKGKEELAEAQARNMARNVGLREKILSGGRRSGKEEEMLVLDEQSRKRQVKRQGMGRDENIGRSFSWGDENDVTILSEDAMRDIEAGDVLLAKEKDLNEKFKQVLRFHNASRDRTLSRGQRADALRRRDQAVHAMNFTDFDHFKRKIVDVPGGLMSRDAKANYCIQQYGDVDPVTGNPADRVDSTRALHMYRLLSATSVEQGDDSWHGGTKMDPATGELTLNRKVVMYDQLTPGQRRGYTRGADGQALRANGERVWDWKDADAEAADLTSKREKQKISISATYLSWAEMDKKEGNAIPGSVSSYARVVLEDKAFDGIPEAFWEQARKNPRMENHMKSRARRRGDPPGVNTGRNTIQNWIKHQEATRGQGNSPIMRSIMEIAPAGEYKPTNANHKLWREAGILQLSADGKKITGYNWG